MVSFKNLKDLESYINKQISDSLKTDVAEKSKELLKEKKQEVVYDAYEPYSTDGKTPHYERTYQLLNSNESQMLDENTLEITSPRGADSENGADIAYGVEHSGYYTWGYTRDLNEEIGARPFMEETADELRKGKAKEYMKKALQDRGFKVK